MEQEGAVFKPVTPRRICRLWVRTTGKKYPQAYDADNTRPLGKRQASRDVEFCAIGHQRLGPEFCRPGWRPSVRS